VYSPFPDRRVPLTKAVDPPQGKVDRLILRAETAKWIDVAAVVAGILDKKAI
jgi:hypothetical protein